MASSSWLTYFKSQLWPRFRWTSKIIIIMQSKFNICERYNSLNLKCPPKPTCQRLDPQGVTREVINHWETEFVGSPLVIGGSALEGDYGTLVLSLCSLPPEVSSSVLFSCGDTLPCYKPENRWANCNFRNCEPK